MFFVVVVFINSRKCLPYLPRDLLNRQCLNLRFPLAVRKGCNREIELFSVRSLKPGRYYDPFYPELMMDLPRII